MGQHAIQALALGCLYALLAAGLALMSNTQRTLYVAYGGLYLVGAYLMWWALRAGHPMWMGLVLAPLLCAIFGVLLIGLEQLVRTPRSERAQLLWGLGVLICSMEGYRFIMASDHRKVIAIDSHQIHYLGPLMLSDMHWLVFGCTFGCGAVVHGFLTTSRRGLALQAVLDHPDASLRWHGIDPRLFAAAMGAALAGIGGGLAALYLNDVHPEMGLRLMPKLLCLVMIGGFGGGFGRVRGVVFAAFGLAYAEEVVLSARVDILLPVDMYLLLVLVAGRLYQPHRVSMHLSCRRDPAQNAGAIRSNDFRKAP